MTGFVRTACCLLGTLLLAPDTRLTAAPAEEPPVPFSIHWVADATRSNHWVVEARGFDATTIRELEKAGWSVARWQKLLSVFASQGDLLADIGLPPMLGTYAIDRNRLRFKPAFPFEPGVAYRAVLLPEQLPNGQSGPRTVRSDFQLPNRPGVPSTVIQQIYPTSDLLPENLLKFYLQFSAPMSGGHIYDHIRLLNESGQPVELPFLEIDEELWNPAMDRLTLFIDPGRIKRGVAPLEEIGPALEEGRAFTLVIQPAWRDATGTPMKAGFRKVFRVGRPIRTPIDPKQWQIHTPAARSTRELIVEFDRPMDFALAQRVIHVRRSDLSEALPGTAELRDQEREWAFKPGQPWVRGEYQLEIQHTLEDLAGNNIGKSFEVDLFEGVQRRVTNSVARLAFTIK